MRRKLMQMLVSVTLVFALGHAFGHEDFRVIGTLVDHEESVIKVESRDGTTRSIRVDKQTLVTRDAQKVEVESLQPGISVVVDAYGDSLEDLLALEIRIVPPIEN